MIDIKGESIAGVATNIRLKNPNFMFDCGVTSDLSDHMYNYDHMFLTHGHLDHTSGILHWLYAKHTRCRKPSTIYLNPSYEAKLKALIAANAELQQEQFPVHVDFVPVEPSYFLDGAVKDNSILIPKSSNLSYRLNAFQTDHTIPSQGYLLEECFFNGNGVMTKAKKLMAITGDTRAINLPDALIQNLPVLLHECTYFSNVSLEHANRSGHTRSVEIFTNVRRWLEINPNLKIMLYHFSNRYDGYILELLNQECPADLRGSFSILTP